MRVTWITDMDRSSSGYGNLSVPLMTGLVNRGHRVICLGSGYKGEEHDYPFTLIPVAELGEANGMVRNLTFLKESDVVVIALDINIQESFLMQPWRKEQRYVGIFPVESDPISMSWASVLHMMDARLVLSKFGVGELNAAGLTGKFLPISLDQNAWRPPGPEERSQIRKLMGVKDDDFIVIACAENQERKHLSRAMEIFREFTNRPGVPNSKFWMVTRSRSPFGWRCDDLAVEFGLSDRFAVMERGMPQKNLWALFAAADVQLLTSKCEGLGLVALESMACGLPVCATNCTALTELMDDGRGFPISYDYSIRDPFMGVRRYMASIQSGADALMKVSKMTPDERLSLSHRTVDFVKQRTFENSIDVLEAALGVQHA
jgi:glycosyltransferase involved in cell wall biosynthesis